MLLILLLCGIVSTQSWWVDAVSADRSALEMKEESCNMQVKIFNNGNCSTANRKKTEGGLIFVLSIIYICYQPLKPIITFLERAGDIGIHAS